MPTPVKWRTIGDSILLLGTLISTTMLTEYEKVKELFGVTDLKHWVAASIILTVAGKVITNFVAVQETKPETPVSGTSGGDY